MQGRSSPLEPPWQLPSGREQGRVVAVCLGRGGFGSGYKATEHRDQR